MPLTKLPVVQGWVLVDLGASRSWNEEKRPNDPGLLLPVVGLVSSVS